MVIVYLGLGSNLGNKEHNLKRAIEFMEKHGIYVRKRSSLYETQPWGERNQPMFLNMVLEAETDLTPHALLGVLKDIESQVGRGQSYRWGPRTIDLDILLYNHMILNEEILKIPHPFMHQREFVLRPLAEIAPDVIHPGLQLTVRELFVRCSRMSTTNHGRP